MTALTSFIALPLKFPAESRGEMFDSGVVVGLVLPVAVLSSILSEGPSDLVAGSSRRLTLSRVVWGGAFLASVVLLSWAVAAIAPVPADVLVADAALVSAVLLLGCAAVGLTTAWLLPLLTVAVLSAPGVVPWRWNLVYGAGDPGTLAAVVAGVVAIGLTAYAMTGSLGVMGGRARLGAVLGRGED